MYDTTAIKPCLNLVYRDGYSRLDRQECVERGKELAAQYQSASPYPHAVLTNFLSEEVLKRIVDEFPPHEPGRFSDAQSNLKTGYQLEKITSPYINSVINALNSAAFLDFLQELTGIKGLISDPYQEGGGLHETRRGGHLSIHADFNMHPDLKLKRRLNLILFLNENWEDEFGGHLELWSRDMSQCCKKVRPDIGSAVIFNTDEDAFHGHPDPLTCPDDRTRRSIALYYYSADATLVSDQLYRTTNFRIRPGSSDKVDVSNSLRHLAKDLCPPILFKLFKG